MAEYNTTKLREELDSFQENLETQQNTIKIEADREPCGICIICDELLYDAPTNRFWFHLMSNRKLKQSKFVEEGICYNCVLHFMQLII